VAYFLAVDHFSLSPFKFKIAWLINNFQISISKVVNNEAILVLIKFAHHQLFISKITSN
jgi:hypothetical protein